MTYTSSFSKTVAPGLRTGFFVLPEADAAGFEERAVSTYISPPYLAQATIAEFIEGGRFEPNLEHVCGELRLRRDAMLEALERTFPASASWSRPEGGYFLWLALAGGSDTSNLAARADAAGVGVVRGADFFPSARSELGTTSLRLAFSYETPERIAEGVERLSQLL